MVRDNDLATAALIATVIAVVALCWSLRARGRDLAGHWATQAGALYELRATGRRSFEARGPRTPPAAGKIVGLRGLRLAPGGRGSVDLRGRRIDWDGGEVWTRQGVV